MITIKLGDITKEAVDVIVNAANTGLRGVAEFVSVVPKLKVERGWHGLYDGRGPRGGRHNLSSARRLLGALRSKVLR